MQWFLNAALPLDQECCCHSFEAQWSFQDTELNEILMVQNKLVSVTFLQTKTWWLEKLRTVRQTLKIPHSDNWINRCGSHSGTGERVSEWAELTQVSLLWSSTTASWGPRSNQLHIAQSCTHCLFITSREAEAYGTDSCTSFHFRQCTWLMIGLTRARTPESETGHAVPVALHLPRRCVITGLHSTCTLQLGAVPCWPCLTDLGH